MLPHPRFILLWVILLGGLIPLITMGNGNHNNAHSSTELTVLAAASMTEAVSKLASIYEKKHPDIRILPTYASSGALQKQIEAGAPGDLFLSAGEKEMSQLVQAHLIHQQLHKPLLSNQLVLIVPATNTKVDQFADLKHPTVKQIIIGQPTTVPAGRYAKQTLDTLHLTTSIHGKLIYAGDVRQVFASVQTGNADAGLVYRSDTRKKKNIRIVDTAPAESHEPIRYPIGVLSHTKHPKEAQAFYNWLQGETALGVFHQAGFQIRGASISP
ncbi:molybdate ABC transporter substrate-binding protein [Marininema halotolerans]|uniref:Molybdate transport system substrate-binding protein n=1 Tax=Marininema halotolerans TaxID=1155944 RepID=A0A1I6RGS4_9BACL|nr:molybdate ABC transporter substrate-binding protein [Marininema halotolerans]SFS63790.1 molybdate transport system substrate-binding protein [Marininema halotolerans]